MLITEEKKNNFVMSPSPNPDHQTLSFRIGLILGFFLESKNDNGYVASAPCDVKFDDGNILQPDLLYITEQRKSEIVKERIIGAPDLIVEILSPSNAYYDLRQKKDIYEKYGVKEYIIIDPVLINADLYALKDGIYYLHQRAEKTELLNSLILPGLSFDLKRIFR